MRKIKGLLRQSALRELSLLQHERHPEAFWAALGRRQLVPSTEGAVGLAGVSCLAVVPDGFIPMGLVETVQVGLPQSHTKTSDLHTIPATYVDLLKRRQRKSMLMT